MATVSKWTPFGVALNLTATAGTVTRTSTTQYTVKINVSWETYYSGAKTNYGMTASSGGSSATINTFGTKSSSGSGSFTGTYSISGNSGATKTITVTFKNFNNDNGQSATKTVSFNVTVPAWPSYTITYNDNGGSGGPGKQTKWKNQALTISSVKPTRTGYTFQGWGTSASATTATYSAGGTYPASSNANATLYAVWKILTYTIKYNANGGSSTPSNQTKNYGTAITLAGAITRTNYTFKGWATSATATSAAYAAGASYTKNASVTLYAVWELSYTKPRITGCKIERCNVDGMATESGTYAMVSFSWETDKEGATVTIKWKPVTDTSYSSTNTLTLTDSGTAGVYTNYVFGGASLSTDIMYNVQLTVADSVDSTTVTTTLASENFLIDFLNDGTGIAIGKAATISNTLDIYKKTIIRGSADASGTSESGQFIIGDPNDLHLAMDNNEIMAKSNSTTPSTITINYEGGNVGIGNKNSSTVTLNGDIKINSNTAGLTNRSYGTNKVLWSGGYYMSNTHTITLSEAITAQPNGIILIWSSYSNSAPSDSSFWTTTIPKQFITSYAGYGIYASSTQFYCTISKYLYISNTSITGYERNDDASYAVSASGVTLGPASSVLRAVVGY